MALSSTELTRYARHLALSEIGSAGQEKLRAARVLVVGAGGLGSPAALYLAASGIGTLGLVDCDRVDGRRILQSIETFNQNRARIFGPGSATIVTLDLEPQGQAIATSGNFSTVSISSSGSRKDCSSTSCRSQPLKSNQASAGILRGKFCSAAPLKSMSAANVCRSRVLLGHFHQG